MPAQAIRLLRNVSESFIFVAFAAQMMNIRSLFPRVSFSPSRTISLAGALSSLKVSGVTGVIFFG